MREWYEQLDGRGLRATGSAEHQSYIDQLRARLPQLGVSGVVAEDVPLTRWSASQPTLDVVSGRSAGSLPVANYIPYSGPLPGGSVTGELVYMPDPTAPGATPPAPGSLAGKIAVFDITIPPYTLGLFALFGYQIYNKPGFDLTAPYVRSYLAQGDVEAQEVAAQAAGAVAAIAILPLNEFASKGMYMPYDGVIHRIPGAFVSQGTGAKLKTLAGTGTRVRIRMKTEVKKVQAQNLYGFIPGEGQYLWNNGGIADTNYITGPSYLLNAGMRTTGYVDYGDLRRKAIAFTDMALGLTRASRASLREPKPTHSG